MFRKRSVLDTPAHGLVGRLVALSVWPNERGYVNLVTVASMIPDLDVFISNSALDGLQTHRGITHSFMGVAVGAGGVGCPQVLVWRKSFS
ncbi:MAG TPA: hypothetical protein DIU35_15470 [Candidatus Latescibacteria bacterium]|nr:hypothetical protein [Gemmatimonadota bacterium]HCR18880.1 hypothetical protein [Candidatus Latescibacterota bacterium]